MLQYIYSISLALLLPAHHYYTTKLLLVSSDFWLFLRGYATLCWRAFAKMQINLFKQVN